MATLILTYSTPSDAYKADLSIANDGIALITSCDGIFEQYHGIAMENDNIGISITLAESGDAFKAVVENKELFKSILDKLESSRIGGIEQYHTKTVTDPRKALSGPVVEVGLVSLKNPTPENRATFERIAGNFNKLTNGTYGWAVEDNNKVLFVSSWDSLEAQQARAMESDAADDFKQFLELIEDTPYKSLHFKLLKAGDVTN